MSDKQNKKTVKATNTRSRDKPSPRSEAMSEKSSQGRGIPSSTSLVRMPRLENERSKLCLFKH